MRRNPDQFLDSNIPPRSLCVFLIFVSPSRSVTRFVKRPQLSWKCYNSTPTTIRVRVKYVPPWFRIFPTHRMVSSILVVGRLEHKLVFVKKEDSDTKICDVIDYDVRRVQFFKNRKKRSDVS